MRDFLIALAILAVAGAYLVHRVRKGGTKEERRRTRAIADATARRHGPLKNPEEQKLADEWQADTEEKRARTGEQPLVRAAPPVRKRHVYRGPTARQLEAMRSRLLAPT